MFYDSILKLAQSIRLASQKDELERLEMLMREFPNDPSLIVQYRSLTRRHQQKVIDTLPDYDLNQEEVDLSGKEIKSLAWMSGISAPNLKTLRLSENKIDSLVGLDQINAPGLIHLYLDSNSLSRLDVSDLHFPSLEFLSINSNNISNIDKISSWVLPKLKTISLVNNKIEEIIPFSAPRLERMLLGINRITSLSPLEDWDLPRLKEINLYSNLLTSLDGLENINAQNLTLLSVKSNRLRGINYHGIRYIFPNLRIEI